MIDLKTARARHLSSVYSKYDFLDFETNIKGDFYAAGYIISGDFQQEILTSKLQGLASHLDVKVNSAEDFAREFLEGILSRRTTLVAYSTAEQNTLLSLLPNDHTLLKGIQYCNLAKAARRWVAKFKQKEFKDLPPLVKSANNFSSKRHPKSLASICRLIGFEAPADYAIGKTTSRFNTVISSLEKKNQNYQQLTAVQKAKATKGMKHNRYDVEAMVQLLIAIKEADPKILEKATSPLLSD